MGKSFIHESWRAFHLWIITMFMAGESPVSQAMTVNSKHNNSRFNKWLEILALKDYQRNTARARTVAWNLAWGAEKKVTMGNHGAQRTSLSTVKAMWSTQRPQTCTEAVTNYYIITLQTKPMKRGNTDCQQFRRSGNSWSAYSQSYLLWCNDRQQKLHNLYKTRQEYLSKGLRTAG